MKPDIDKFIEDNLSVASWGAEEVSCYCPVHDNTDSPSFSINRQTGLWVCFNPACGAHGSLATLADRLGVSHSWSKKQEDVSEDDLMKVIMDLKDEAPEEDWDGAMERVTLDYSIPEDVAKLQYLIDRGFHPNILEHFEIGYSTRKKRIVIPVREENYKLVGFLGRTTDPNEKNKYENSARLPKAHILYNLHNAKIHGTCIVTEGSLDCIKVHQAGFPNVVSVLGAMVTNGQGALLNKYFNEIILFLDNDIAGQAAIRAIMDMCSGKNIWILTYPEGVKDPGDMTEDQIRDTLNTKIDYLSYYYDKGEIK